MEAVQSSFTPEFERRFTSVLRQWAEVFMRRSMHDFNRFSKESGLSIAQLSVAFRLYHVGGCGVSDIGDQLGVTDAAASQMVDRLVKQGLLERFEDPKDRRGKRIELTPNGRQIVEESIEARRRWLEHLTKALSPDQLESISEALITLTHAALSLEQVESIY